MNSIARFVAAVAGLVLVLNVTPGWGGPPNPTGSDANENTAGGAGALLNVVAGAAGGVDNTAFGFGALTSNTTGDNNTASGFEALFLNVSGSGNTATGWEALIRNTAGGNNTATGASALQFNSTGGNNTATGVEALSANTTGTENTATGFHALFTNTVGRRNTAVGRSALLHSIGTKNIGIGYQAGATLTTGNNNIFIGNQGNGDESQTIRIGTAQSATFIAGIASAPISLDLNGATMAVDTTTGQLGIGVTFSSARYKRDIVTMGARSEGVLDLRPVTFVYRDDSKGALHYGLIAEEVAAVYPELVTRTSTGEVETVKYQELIPILLNELQRQRQTLQGQAQALQHQQQELADLRALVRQGHETASWGR